MNNNITNFIIKSMKSSKIAVLLAALILFAIIPTLVQAAAPAEQWNKTFGGIMDDANSVQQTSDGGYIVAGESWGGGGRDAWLIKVDSNGNQQWNKTFGESDIDYASSVQQTSDGGYIIAGTTIQYGAGGEDAWLIKTDSSGNELWNKTFGGSNYDVANSVDQTSDGGYIVAGGTVSYGAGDSDAWLIKVDSSGNQQWNETFGEARWDNAESVQQTSDGGYIIAGGTESYGASWMDAWLIKTDSNGNQKWSKTFWNLADHWEYVYSVQQTADGEYILAGDSGYGDGGSNDALLIKVDSNGNKKWSKIFDGTSSEGDNKFSVDQTSDGGYIVAGSTNSYGAGEDDALLIKVDSNGNQQWNKTFGGSMPDSAYSVQQTSDGGYIIAGTTRSYGTGIGDAWLIKVAPLSLTSSYDNRLRESSSCSVLGTTPYIDVGKSTSRARDVMWFNLNMYNTTDTISRATLSLFWYYPAGKTRTSDTVVEIYRPGKWNPKYVTWYYHDYRKAWKPVGGAWFDANGVAQGTTPYASVTFPAGTVPDNKYYEFDVTQLVQEYVTGTNNTGFFLKAKTESGNYIAFYSSDWRNADQRPKLTVTSS
ncbi:disaggregatase related repeat-containing protein [Methanomethylovorans sp.]|uniref:disaggregatase related repeat-containing protein n=1 Tax=Methanomethylovorans sp. TaxID=2758717 RepID=UPI00351CB60B